MPRTRFFRWFALIVLVATGMLSTGYSRLPQAAASGGHRFVPNEVLVQFRSGAAETDKSASRSAVGATRIETIRPARSRSGDLELLRLPTGLSVQSAIAALHARGAVVFAEPNWIYTRDATSNDPYYTDGSLWGLQGDSASQSREFGSHAVEAWSSGYTGSADVYVGIVDEGIYYRHEDLNANMWRNPFEPLNGLDDDGNGYADDAYGWDFASGDNSIFDGAGSTDTTTDAHGTHVSGTIGGVGGNGKGVAGVNWQVKLISAKFLGPSGGTTANAVKALDYLTDLKTRHGLNIVASNNSWGGGGYSQALYDAIERASQADILFIAAAGNGGSDGVGDNNDVTPSYPASYANSNIISVAAIDSRGKLTGWSNYGPSTVDLGAPGAAIYSTTPWDTYSSYSGTSMATPHVTGAAALYAATHPGATATQIRTAILSATTPTSSLGGKTVTGGRLDVAAALAATGGSTTTGTIAGSVTDSAGSSIGGAAVSVSGTTLSATTDASGQYTIPNVPAGTQSVNATASGYDSQAQSVSVTAASTSTATFALIPASNAALAVSVSTDAASYTVNSTVYLTVHVADGTSPTPGATVSVTVYTASGRSYSSSGTTDANGNTILSYKIRQPDGTGTYTASASAAAPGYTDGTGSITFTVSR